MPDELPAVTCRPGTAAEVGQRLHRGVPRVFVGVDQPAAGPLRCGISIGRDLPGHPAGRDRLGRPFLRSQGERVLVRPATVKSCGDVLRGLRHRVGAESLLHPRVDEAPTDGGVGDLGAPGKRRVGLGSTNGARLMLSTPPAMIRSASPARIARAAIPTASRPDPQSRLIVLPGASSGRSASSAAIRATLRLSSPAWFAQPSSTSSRADQSTDGRLGLGESRTTWAARSSGRTVARAPTYRPIGCRTPATRNA